MTNRMPAIFFGHGNPMNAIDQNRFTEGWRKMGNQLPPPEAILCISAHWYLPATLVTAMNNPRTIHDFGGFPRELFEFQYPAPGDPDLAARIRDLLSPAEVGADNRWGLDHGTWSVLCHVFPESDVPVVQLSIDETKPARFHYELGKRLTPLRDEGILVIGSGNVVHNLHAYAWGKTDIAPFDWAVSFENLVRQCVFDGDHDRLVSYESLGREAKMSAPTPDHYLPLLYVLATQREDDPISFPVEGFDGGSISMLTIQFG